MMKNRLLRKIQDLTLTANEIEDLIDAANITDEIVDFIASKYEREIRDDESFSRIKDVVQLVDLTKRDEQDIVLSEAAKRSFCSLMMAGKLSRLEIVYFVKRGIATDDEIDRVLSAFPSADLIDVALRWRPQLFETRFRKYCAYYRIHDTMIADAKSRTLNLEKFKFVSQQIDV